MKNKKINSKKKKAVEEAAERLAEILCLQIDLENKKKIKRLSIK